MSKDKKKGSKRAMFVLLCVGVFFITFVGSAVFKMTYKPEWSKKYSVEWSDKIGAVHNDIAYGEGAANKFDLYVPADNTRENYGLVVYLHAGGFTTGDKSDDKTILQWLCSKGYVTAGINYTLRTDENDKNIYSQSMEIKEAMPVIIEEAKKLGYNLDEMVISGGSAGGTLAMLYAYRDSNESPIPVRMMFEMVGPSSFYAEDWGIYGLDKSSEAAAGLFSVMGGVELTPEMIESGEYTEMMKPISAFMWIDENTCPSLLLYGTHDKMQPWNGVRHLVGALQDNGVDYKLFEASHSGHGAQNDDKVSEEFMDTVVEYLDKYMPVD